MKRRIALPALAGLGFLAVSFAASHHEYKLEEHETVRHTFPALGALDVENVNGLINVVGDDGKGIRVEAERSNRADEPAAMQNAKKNVRLEMTEKDGVAMVHVKHDNDHDQHYSVRFDITVHVPRATRLRAHTVNGPVKIDDTDGKFDVKSVNGAIAMNNVAGSGSVETLNGKTVVKFRRNPEAESLFKSFNGDVDVTLLTGLAADVKVKTFNGNAYTDFEATALANTPAEGERKNGKYVYRSNRSTSLRIGGGGPELKFETFNGQIRIHKQ